MSIGLLLTINFLTIPFLQEAAELGTRTNRFPTLVDIIRLRLTLKQRWFKLFCIFMVIFLAIVMAPTRSGNTYVAGYGLIFSILVIQVILWALLYLKITSFNK